MNRVGVNRRRGLAAGVMRQSGPFGLLLVVALEFATPALAQVWQYQGVREAATALASQTEGLPPYFGTALALSPEWLAVGVPYTDLTLGPVTWQDTGAVYLYQRDADGRIPTVATQIIRSDQLANNAHFGFALAIDGSTLMIGMPGHGNSAGRVEFWNYSTGDGAWDRSSAFDGNLASFGSESLGYSVSLNGNHATAGAPNATIDPAQPFSGRVVTFARVSSLVPFTNQHTLVSPNPTAGGYFGFDVAIRVEPIMSLLPDRLVIGEAGAGVGAPPKGLAWVYEYDTGQGVWSLGRLIAASENEIGYAFGHAVALNGRHVLVGGLNASRVLVEQRDLSGWTSRPPLQSPAGGETLQFGYDIAVHGPRWLIGQPVPGSPGSRALVFEAEGLGDPQHKASLRQQGPAAAPWYSYARVVALQGEQAVVAAPTDDVELASEVGFVALFASSGLFSDGFESSLD